MNDSPPRATENRAATAALVGITLLITSCLGALDIFVPSIRLPGGFRLEQFETTHYYIQRGNWDEPGGVLRGEIGEIGWDEHRIVARRSAMIGSEKSGWMIIDVRAGTIDGPFSPEEFRDRMARDSGLHDIKVRSVGEVWSTR